MIYDALLSDAIEEVEFHKGQVVDRQWILHHFDFRSFRIFGFLDDFAMPTARPGDSVSTANDYEHNIQRAFYSLYLCCHGLQGTGCVPTYWYYWVRVYYRALAE